jgi:hypothetical protein
MAIGMKVDRSSFGFELASVTSPKTRTAAWAHPDMIQSDRNPYSPAFSGTTLSAAPKPTSRSLPNTRITSL